MMQKMLLRMLWAVAAAIFMTGQAGAQQPVVPNAVQLSIMIKTTLVALNNANVTGNYTVLRDLSSPAFQQAHNPAGMGEIFRAEREKKIDLSPIVVLRPVLYRPASINAQGRLHVEGYFPSRPSRVNFTLEFEAISGRWRLSGLGTRTVPVPVAATARRNNPASASFVHGLGASWPYWIGYGYVGSR